MARPTKTGLDYFPLDVDMDQDDKIFYIETKYGATGFAVIVRLYMRIYKNGYFCNWGEKEQLMFSRKVNVNINTLSDIVNDCINEGLFNKEVYEKYGVLTSSGIQNRFLEACSRRKEVEINENYLVIDVSKYTNVVIVNINKSLDVINVNNNDNSEQINEEKSTQSKVKESKVKESKVEIIEDEEVAAIDSKKNKDIEELNNSIYENPLEIIENNYKQAIGRNFIGSNDLNEIVKVFETYKDVEFIIKCIEQAVENNKRKYGRITIKSFSYITTVIEDEYKKLQLREHGNKVVPIKGGGDIESYRGDSEQQRLLEQGIGLKF